MDLQRNDDPMLDQGKESDLPLVLPERCCRCDEEIGIQCPAMMLVCQCLVALCHTCAVAELENRPKTYASYVLCPVCGVSNSKQDGVLKFSKETLQAEETELVQRALSHYGLRQTKLNELQRYQQLYDCFRKDGSVPEAVERITWKNDSSVYKLLIARLEFLVRGEVNAGKTNAPKKTTINVAKLPSQLPLGPLRWLNISRNGFLVTALTDPSSINMMCLICSEEFVPGTSIRFTCDCTMLVCRICALRGVQKEADTFTRDSCGVRCFQCRAITPNILIHRERAVAQQTFLLDSASSFLKELDNNCRFSRLRCTSDVVAAIQEYFAHDLIPPDFSPQYLEDGSISYRQLSLDVAIVEAHRLKKPSPIDMLDCVRHPFVESFLNYLHRLHNYSDSDSDDAASDVEEPDTAKEEADNDEVKEMMDVLIQKQLHPHPQLMRNREDFLRREQQRQQRQPDHHNDYDDHNRNNLAVTILQQRNSHDTTGNNTAANGTGIICSRTLLKQCDKCGVKLLSVAQLQSHVKTFHAQISDTLSHSNHRPRGRVNVKHLPQEEQDLEFDVSYVVDRRGTRHNEEDPVSQQGRASRSHTQDLTRHSGNSSDPRDRSATNEAVEVVVLEPSSSDTEELDHEPKSSPQESMTSPAAISSTERTDIRIDSAKPIRVFGPNEAVVLSDSSDDEFESQQSRTEDRSQTQTSQVHSHSESHGHSQTVDPTFKDRIHTLGRVFDEAKEDPLEGANAMDVDASEGFHQYDDPDQYHHDNEDIQRTKDDAATDDHSIIAPEEGTKKALMVEEYIEEREPEVERERALARLRDIIDARNKSRSSIHITVNNTVSNRSGDLSNELQGNQNQDQDQNQDTSIMNIQQKDVAGQTDIASTLLRDRALGAVYEIALEACRRPGCCALQQSLRNSNTNTDGDALNREPNTTPLGNYSPVLCLRLVMMPVISCIHCCIALTPLAIVPAFNCWENQSKYIVVTYRGRWLAIILT